MATKKIQILDSLIKQAENANMLGGKTVDEFALAMDFEALKSLVGDSAVSEQIDSAITSKAQVQFITWEADD